MAEQPDSLHLAASLRTVVTRLIKQLRSHSPTRATISLSEREVIKLLDQRQPQLPGELAAAIKVTSQAMSQILNRLSALGYITREPLATDRRKVLIGRAPAGQALLHAVRHEGDEWLLQALDTTCSAQERATLHAALPVLLKLADAAP